MKIKRFEDEDLPKLFELINRSISTNRSHDTWHNMTAVLSSEGDNLIGAIPLEKRTLSFGADKYEDVLWVSAAHVDPEYRSQGIGRKMDQKIKEFFYPDYIGTFVYREDEKSRAYNWYKQLGFCEIVPIVSVNKKVTKTGDVDDYLIINSKADVEKNQRRIYQCFNHNTKRYSGFPNRHENFWTEKLSSHYYKDSYQYCMILLFDGDDLSGYSFLGQTDLRDDIKRFDILEFITPDNDLVRKQLFTAINNQASQNNLDEIRIQLTTQDPHLKWFQSVGFSERWNTNVMGKLYDPIKVFRDRVKDKIDLRNETRFEVNTPNTGKKTIGKGKSNISISCKDDVFLKLIMNQHNITELITKGEMLLENCKKEVHDRLLKCFPLVNWIHFHIDYI
ncbi:MAG: GNAT family N-acetyltransferase [Pseudomonadota bacterium]